MGKSIALCAQSFSPDRLFYIFYSNSETENSICCMSTKNILTGRTHYAGGCVDGVAGVPATDCPEFSV